MDKMFIPDSCKKFDFSGGRNYFSKRSFPGEPEDYIKFLQRNYFKILTENLSSQNILTENIGGIYAYNKAF